MKNNKETARLKRHQRIRLRACGNGDRPRLMVQRSLKNISAQIIDDTKNKTLFSLSTMNKEIKQKFNYSGNIKAAEYLGEVLAKSLKEQGIVRIVFDRAGYLYHGRVKAFAEAMRKGGLEF